MLKNQHNGSVRIIGGKWRGKKLSVVESVELRPTTDRIKETLFNWLMPVLVEARCLDCYAGSGALGFEALSRYAKESVMLENDPVVFKQLEKNNHSLKSQQAQLIRANTLHWLSQSGVPFDIVFIDPPFRKGLLDQTLLLLEKNGWLAPEAWIYIETEPDLTLFSVPDNWQLHRKKETGQIISRLYYRTSIE